MYNVLHTPPHWKKERNIRVRRLKISFVFVRILLNFLQYEVRSTPCPDIFGCYTESLTRCLLCNNQITEFKRLNWCNIQFRNALFQIRPQYFYWFRHALTQFGIISVANMYVICWNWNWSVIMRLWHILINSTHVYPLIWLHWMPMQQTFQR